MKTYCPITEKRAEYFAVRDEQGEYEGCLEVSQDATYLRSLEGEKRLL